MTFHLSEAALDGDVLLEMLSEQSGCWTITSERVALLREYLPRVSERNRGAIEDMLREVNSGKRIWPCTGEMYAALHEIRDLRREPTMADIAKVLRSVEDGSRRDGVDHRQWVKDAVSLMRRMVVHE